MPSESPVKIQLAIQGGGAKIVTLLAALEAIQDLEKQGKIKVTRIVGTSAGAIAGAFFSANIDLNEVRVRLKNDGDILIKQYSRPTKLGFLKLLFNKPIWNSQKLYDWLNSFYCDQNIITIEDLVNVKKIDFKIVSTDLGSRTAFHEYPKDTNLVHALLDSSGLPFLFRVWNSSSNPVRVDGGLCENLPAHLLKANKEDGYIVGISFYPSSATNPTNIFSFSLALLDTAISYSMSKTRSSLGNSLYEIKTDIGTFDFNKALNKGLDDHYKLIKNDCFEWFNNFVNENLPNSYQITDEISGKTQLMNDPWQETNQTAVYLMSTMSDIYNQHYETKRFKYFRISYIIDANCLIERGKPYHGTPDRIEVIFEFEPTDEPIQCVRFCLFNTPSNAGFLHYSLCCRVNDSNNQPIKWTQIPLRERNVNEIYSRDVCIFFDTPLVKDGRRFTVHFSEEVTNLMEKLRNTGQDDMEIQTTRAHGKIDELHFILRLPNEYGQVTMIPRDSPDGVKLGNAMKEDEIIKYKYHSPNSDFRSIGWVAQNIQPEQIFCVDIFKKNR